MAVRPAGLTEEFDRKNQEGLRGEGDESSAFGQTDL
jgi:hypothetical protein